MSCAPIIVFAYNRCDLLKKVIDSIRDADGASECDLYIFSDGPKQNNDDINKVNEVRDYLDGLEKSGFKNVYIKYREWNIGLANSIISGVTAVIDKYGKAIVIEDDLIVGKSFLKYMNDALEFYQDDKQVWSVSGTMPKIKIPMRYKKDVLLCKRGSSHGWSTWKNRWDSVDWEVEDYKEFKGSSKRQKEFDKCGYGLTDMLDRQLSGKIDYWAIRFQYEQFKQGMFTVYPRVSLVNNIGRYDGRGTHESKETGQYDFHDERINIVVEHIEANPAIERRMYNWTDGNFVVRKLKRLKSHLYCIAVKIGYRNVRNAIKR